VTKKLPAFIICLAALLLGRPAAPSTISSCTTPSGAISCTGTAGTPEDVFLESFTLAASATITVQTYGFGGGTNAAGASILSGGFDSLVALFSGIPAAASILTDGGGNPIASADNLSLFSPGCPLAGLVTVGSVTGVCGDSKLSANLAAGTYTLLLTDANFMALAVNPNLFLGPYNLTDTTSTNYGSSTGNGAYNDLSGGVFQTCASLVDCNLDAGNFAVDITGLSSTSAPVPEPGTLTLLAAGLAMLFRKTLSRKTSRTNGETI
jgi:hypothetical protein